MNRTDLAKEIARREALAAAWKSSAEKLREDLKRQAHQEYEENGNGVTWTMRDLGRVTLPLSIEAPVIADTMALLKWVKATRPDEVETVEQVRAAYQTWLRNNARISDDGHVVLIDEHGQPSEPIPGMAVRPGGRPSALTITVDSLPKRLYAEYARGEVARQLAAEYGEATPEPGPPADIECVGCGKPIRDGEPVDMIGGGYAHAGDGCGSEWGGA